jgi:hypothetical protein
MKSLRIFAVLIFLAMPAFAQQQHHGSSSPSTTSASGDDESMGQSMPSMAARNLSESEHMKMTELRPVQPGDQQRADEVLAGAKKVMERYRDFRVAIADGYQIFLPKLAQKMYHFTNYRYGWEAAFTFDPERPTSLLYEKKGENDFKLIGIMYTAAKQASVDQLDERVPLSIAQWHAHVNLCQAPKGHEKDYLGAHPKFGLLGSITTRSECEAAGGRFLPQVFGWMVHVYPDEKTTAQIWSVERQMEHSHGHMH